MTVDSKAGIEACNFNLVNIADVVSLYYENKIECSNDKYAIAFGTSGHRGSSRDGTYTRAHIEALTQAIVILRDKWGHTGPVFLGHDTHALSECAYKTALEVLCANRVDTVVACNFEVTPTPVISRQIVKHNLNSDRLSDGIIITPSHNPPEDGGFKYNPPHGGPASTYYTRQIETLANEILKDGNKAVVSLPWNEAVKSEYVHFKNMQHDYVEDLALTINMQEIAASNIALAVNPQGGSSLAYWQEIEDFYGIRLNIVNKRIDSSFSFMPYDYDGKIRMDCMSPYTMKPLTSMTDSFDFAIANDPDADRHGVVTKKGLVNSNHYLCCMMHYLLQSRKKWPQGRAVGKTIGASLMMDSIIKSSNFNVYETPIGFKWFSQGLFATDLVFGCEESAGASFLDFNGVPFVTDKDGFTAGLIGAELMAASSMSIDEYYAYLQSCFGEFFYGRDDVPITKEQKEAFKSLNESSISKDTLAGSKITKVLVKAPGNNEDIGGIKVVCEDGFFSARPSGTENLYKIYYESSKSSSHAKELHDDAVYIVNKATGL